MGATVITFGISKGGCGKTTSAGVVAYLLSKESRVLCVDMDGQGNLTSFLTSVMDICREFEQQTVLEAIKGGDVRPYIKKITDTLFLVPSNDLLANLSHYIFTEYKKSDYPALLKKALEPVIDEFDYIIIDSPPALGEHTALSVTASTFAIIMFDASYFCYYALGKFAEICDVAREKAGANVEVLGILVSIVDPRASDTQVMMELIDEELPGLRFDVVIKRKAATKRLPAFGFVDNPELKNALEHYKPFVKELKKRVHQKQNEK